MSMDMYNKIINSSNNYILELLQDNFIDVNLNIKYLINYGITNIDRVIYNMLYDLVISHEDFVKKIKDYEKNSCCGYRP